eukprot:10922521-Alexandrium_andersonii.AAC.1
MVHGNSPRLGFHRACQSKISFPVSLTKMYTERKSDLFRMYMENGQDLRKVAAVVVERMLEKTLGSGIPWRLVAYVPRGR